MSITPYEACIPPCITMLGNIKLWLDKAGEQMPEAELLEARLAPDMYALARQVQIASDIAKGAAARLSGSDAPAMPDTEASFAELKDRCDRTIAFLQGVDPAAVEAGYGGEIVVTFPNGGGMRFNAPTYVSGFVLPNLYFHASMVYAILRGAGVSLGKQDFLAHLAPNMFAPPAVA